MKKNQFLQEISYNSCGASRAPDLIIINPHWDNWDEFLRKYSGVVDVTKEGESVLKRAINLDKDTFVPELIQDIAWKTSVSILELRVCAPRFIIDANRRPINSHFWTVLNPIRHIYNHEAHWVLTQSLQEVHRNIIDRILHIVDGFKGRILDIHTMANVSPLIQHWYSVALKESPGRIQNYLDQWIGAWWEKRWVNVMTKFKDGSCIADVLLSYTLSWKLVDANIETRFNDPYLLSDHMMSTVYMQNWKSTLVDIPKGLVSVQDMDTNLYLPELILCPQKLDKLGSVFASSIELVYAQS